MHREKRQSQKFSASENANVATPAMTSDNKPRSTSSEEHTAAPDHSTNEAASPATNPAEDHRVDRTEKQKEKAAKKAEKLARLQKKKELMLQKETATLTVSKPSPATPPARSTTTDAYVPADVEPRWVAHWRTTGFQPRPASPNEQPPFTICLPPPNITGALHIGHAMATSIQDALARYHRLCGRPVLYLPGLDHAGIATQSVVMRTFGPMDRPTFTQRAHEWSERYGARIYEQFDRLGTSLDYSRKVFTLDPTVSHSVSHAFCELHRRGFIYRDAKIVNWSGRLKTTLSDLEVNFKDTPPHTFLDVDGGRYQFGVMYYIKYRLAQTIESELSNAYVVIGTTRPETIYGDEALCAHPTDRRFANISEIFQSGEFPDPLNEQRKGTAETAETAETTSKPAQLAEHEELKAERKNKYRQPAANMANAAPMQAEASQTARLYAENPVTGKRIPVIFDSHADPAFGTGILKVTPAHDPADFAIGKAHGLPCTQILSEDNRVTAEGLCKGLGRFEARKRVVEFLKDKGMLVREEGSAQVLPICSRSGDVVEPVVREQWWMRCDEFAAQAVEAVRRGEIRLVPAEARQVWERWLGGIRDWCLSRQLWWGHRVPAYRAYFTGGKADGAGNASGAYEWIVAATPEEAEAEGARRGAVRVEQDEDVLDTWFSSGLWPFSTLGWPRETADFQRFFPNTLLETGSDILFFWVARMVMLSYALCGKRPFDTVLLHGLVRDSHGRKMSKSLGNVIDPLHVVDGISLEEMVAGLGRGNLDPREVRRAADAIRKDFPQGIPRCGADALRFTLLSYMNGAKDINLDVLRVRGNARLCNKLYNAYKCVRKGAESVEGLFKSASQGADVSLSINTGGSVGQSAVGEKERAEAGEGEAEKCQQAATPWLAEPNARYVNQRALAEKAMSVLKGSDCPSHCRWIIQRMNDCIRESHRCLSAYNFMEATQNIYAFFMNDFCDTYLEVCKERRSPQAAAVPLEGTGGGQASCDGRVAGNAVGLLVFKGILGLFSPFMPFITAELFGRLFGAEQAEYPQEMAGAEGSVEGFVGAVELARRCRGKRVAVRRFAEVEAFERLLRGEVVVDEEAGSGDAQGMEEFSGIRYRIID